MVVFYLAALAVLFVSAFWSIDSFTGKLTHTWTWANFHTIFSDPTYREIAWRTIWMAARSEEHTSELQSRRDLVCRLLLEKKKRLPTKTGPAHRSRRHPAPR